MKPPDNHPYLIAWIGFVAWMSLIGLFLGLLLSTAQVPTGLSDTAIEVVTFAVLGYYLFKYVVNRHILTTHSIDASTSEKNEGDVRAQFPYLVAWSGYCALSLIPTVIVGYVVALFPFASSIIQIFVSIAAWAVVGFFVFKFVVRRSLSRNTQVNAV